ncbi:MAG TPA: type II secretion system F family protein [Thermoanaerobaculia bacterium]|nr:type II secretion system F family protein [Thermoanaerobaculia bacterium]
MQFHCRVGTPDGRVMEEVLTASDETSLRNDLVKRGYHVFDVRRRGVPRKLAVPGGGTGRRKRLSDQDFLLWNQELAALLKAGLPLLQALDLMLERMKNAQFRSVLIEIRDQVKSGVDLSEAFASYGDMFPRLYPSTLKAGERSGELEAVIRRFIRYMRLVLDARRRVVSALIYPAVLVGLSIAMLVIMAIYVVPKFMGFFAEMGTELPLVTRMVLAVSSFASQNWPVLLIGIVGGTFLFKQWGKTNLGRLAIDRAKLRVPFLGAVLHRFALSEFSRSLSTLLAGGIPLVPAFEIAASSVGNVFVRSRVEPTIQMVREGKPFHSALEESGVFVDMAVDMVKVGEATGSLDDMLTSVSDFLDEQIETRMQRILSLIEPLMLVVMGIMIAIILVAIYLPMFGMLGQSKF